MQRIYAEGLNYKTAGLALREKLYIPARQQGEALARVLKAPGVRECMILSTCNRTDIYYVCGDETGGGTLDALCRLKNIKCGTKARGFYFYRGHEAVEHVFRVASSLDSMIVGENEVTGQFKDAYNYALENKSAGRVLTALFQAAMAVEKKVRNTTGIGDGAVSVSHAAVELAAGIFGTLKGKRVLLVGAGKMANLAAQHFRKKGAVAIDVLNKTYEKAVDLSKKFGGIAYGFPDMREALAQADIILASTDSEKPVIKTVMVRKIMADRKQPLHILDIAVPRDTEPGIKRLKNVHVHDIDDLKNHAGNNLERRKRGFEAAGTVIRKAVEKFEKLLVMKGLAPVISGIKEKIYGIAVEESAKTARMNSLPKETAALVEKNTIAVVDTIINRHMSELKKQVEMGAEYENLIKLIKEAFKI